mgnify:CR=1
MAIHINKNNLMKFFQYRKDAIQSSRQHNTEIQIINNKLDKLLIMNK